MIRRHLPKLFAAAFLGLVLFGLSNNRGSANIDPWHGKIEAFIEAAAAVDGLIAIWQPKIVRAGEDRADAMRRQANSEIRQRVEEVEGISLVEYQQMRNAIAADPELLARVTEMMRQRPDG